MAWGVEQVGNSGRQRKALRSFKISRSGTSTVRKTRAGWDAFGDERAIPAKNKLRQWIYIQCAFTTRQKVGAGSGGSKRAASAEHRSPSWESVASAELSRFAVAFRVVSSSTRTYLLRPSLSLDRNGRTDSFPPAQVQCTSADTFLLNAHNFLEVVGALFPICGLCTCLPSDTKQCLRLAFF